MSRETQFFSKAGADDVPRDVKISNISDNSFTVTWQTLKPVLGFVSFGTTEAVGSTAGEDRETGGPKPYSLHHVTVKNLTPATNYYFKIGSGSKIYDDRGKAYVQQTVTTIQKPPAVPEPVIGKVIKTDKSGASDAIVYVKIGTGSLLSSYTREDGNFLVTLNNARGRDLTEYISVLEGDTVEIEVNAGAEGSGKKQIKAADRENGVTIQLTGAAISSDTKSEPAENTTGSKLKDLNGDGKINAIDAVMSRKSP